MAPFVVLALGLLLIFLEFYLPGAVLGILGGGLVTVSLFMYAAVAPSLFAFALYFLAVCVMIYYLIKFALWKIKTTKPEYSIYSDDDQQGFVASHYDKSAVGKTGLVLTDLKPGGYILIDGIQHQAISESGYIVKGASVEVLSGQEESLIVKCVKTEGL